MILDLNDPEGSFLIHLLEVTHKEKLHELHHTDSNAFKAELRKEIELIETLVSKLARAHHWSTHVTS